jgi:DNA-directed RNA polymerase subunit F
MPLNRPDFNSIKDFTVNKMPDPASTPKQKGGKVSSLVARFEKIAEIEKGIVQNNPKKLPNKASQGAKLPDRAKATSKKTSEQLKNLSKMDPNAIKKMRPELQRQNKLTSLSKMDPNAIKKRGQLKSHSKMDQKAIKDQKPIIQISNRINKKSSIDPESAKKLMNDIGNITKKMDKKSLEKNKPKLRKLNETVLEKVVISSKAERTNPKEHLPQSIQDLVKQEKNYNKKMHAYNNVLGKLKNEGKLKEDDFNTLTKGLDELLKTSDELVKDMENISTKNKDDIDDSMNQIKGAFSPKKQINIGNSYVNYLSTLNNNIFPKFPKMLKNNPDLEKNFEVELKTELKEQGFQPKEIAGFSTLGINSFAAEPFQRVLRYPMVLEELGKMSGDPDTKDLAEFSKAMGTFVNIQSSLV